MVLRGLRVRPLFNTQQVLTCRTISLQRAFIAPIRDMPPKKRKSSSISAINGASSDTNKRGKPDLTRPHPHAKDTEDFGIVLRDFYPPEMCNERCEAYNNGTLERPIESLQMAYEDTFDERQKIEPKAAVVHWFKTDLRLHDNRGLQMAYQVAREHNLPLIGLYILSPEDLTAHLSSAPRVDLTLRTLELLRRDLNELDIPLYMETQEARKDIPQRIIDLCQEWGAGHLFANLEYEVDELRREANLVRLCARNDIRFEAAHDTCVVTPGKLVSQQGKQYAVYSPWFRSWCAFLNENPEYLEVADEPGSNPGDARKHFKTLFDCEVPVAPENKRLTEEQKTRFRELYPEGEHEALRRLEAFLEEKAHDYDDLRNSLAGRNTSVLSPYFASGALSARTAVFEARKKNKGQLNANHTGYASWISEVAWRDFYKHVLVHWPFICMNKCFKPEFTNLAWSYDKDHFNAWCEGKTGYPIVDAAMRQMNHAAWMHNRTRMVVSSFLSKDLLIDWRAGERYFMEHLIDGDFASNHGGWGFGSSTGVDPQPYFRIFNPLRQSERFDPEGEYIRHWVPELRAIEGAAVHDPYGRGAGDIAERNGYPRPIVDHSQSRDRALENYKKVAQGR
ncbi:deoxyribodipyrimidine photo-lyase PHR1 [Aspergillus neoniger CBS 115656]|uniref:Deoxyribodipyrimidine photo-lyase Phr1 n=1 Tax=Aspergillus neoniger (strain CBS 115656) TaxID=1448310 RepID=A0A318ZE25_ASPNB|nr:deoxyribodipyrimidine photo-lyase Phr1 [Aspergillus neoniger CBS 115656]PYH34392.1 deoxyribodipyrimidine photo-lyase Phr1 [Aspergillus neoniger CBS 115656]